MTKKPIPYLAFHIADFTFGISKRILAARLLGNIQPRETMRNADWTKREKQKTQTKEEAK